MIVDIATGEVEDKSDTGLTKRARAGGKGDCWRLN
jgi:hypothetical protein